jgi:hypothetical protein
LVDPEPELLPRVSAEVQDDDAVTMPALLGSGTVSEDVLPGNDVVPRIRRGAPRVGLNRTIHAGVFSPPFPLPDALKSDQSKITDPQVAVAVPVAVTVCDDPLATKITSTAITSGMTCRERRMIARRLPPPVAAGVNPSAAMLSLLSLGRVLDLPPPGREMPARGVTSDEGSMPQTGAGY